MSKNPHAVALGRKGGSVKSDRKRLANIANLKKRWQKYRENKLQKVLTQ